MTLVDHHLGFVGALRDAGIPVSASESLDALEAIRALPRLDRPLLEAAYSASTVKRSAHQDAFALLFDIWFPAAVGDGVAGPAEQRRSVLPPALDPEVKAFRERVLQALLGDDQARLRALAREAVARFGRGPDGTEWSVRHVQDVLLPRTLLAPLLSAAQVERGGTDDRVARQLFGTRIDRLLQGIEEEVRRRVAEERGNEQVSRDVRRPLEELDFSAFRKSDLPELRQEVQRLSRKLAVRLAARERRRRRGRLDLRRTMRASLATGGVPLTLHRAPPRRSRPDLVVLCDVSESMLSFSRFALMFAFALQERFSRVRAFAFVDTADEVTRYFAGGAEPEDATRRLLREARIVDGVGRSDYARALDGFEARFGSVVTSRTSLLILGDARSNYGDPGLASLRRLAGAARRAYWLNPEARTLWGLGDSAADEYRRVIDMVECRNLVQLSAFVEHVA